MVKVNWQKSGDMNVDVVSLSPALQRFEFEMITRRGDQMTS